MYRTTKKKLVKRVGVSAVIALGALATGAGVASAAPSSAKGTSATVASSRESAHATVPGPGSRCAPGAGGVVSALTSSSITVVDPSGTSTTFSISSATTVTKDRAIAAVSDLAVGDQVRITPTGAGSTTAQSIDIEQPSVMGTVTAVSGDTITVSGPNGTSETVVVSGATTYTKSGASATLADIAVGTWIFAEGNFSTGSTTNLDATTVGVGVGQGQPGGGQVDQGQPGGGQPYGPNPQGGGPSPAFAHVR